MQSCSARIHFLPIIALLALVQLFAPLVHAHTGDSHQAGVHVHVPGVDQDSVTPELNSDPGIEIGIEAMRRESGSVIPEPDTPPLVVCLPETPAFTAPRRALCRAAPRPRKNRFPDANPSRGPPTAAAH